MENKEQYVVGCANFFSNFSLKKSTGNSQGLIRLSNNSEKTNY